MASKLPVGTEDPPTYSSRLHGWVALYLRRFVARHFSALRVSRAGPPPVLGDGPAVFYSNHPSWWDPAIYMLLGWHLFPEREGYGPMDAEALRKYRIFRRLGAFGVAPGTVEGARRFLSVSLNVLGRQHSILWLTAQGEFADPRRRPPRLRPGLAHLARRLRGVDLVPLAFEYPFWDEKRPEALLRFGAPIRVEEGTIRLKEEWLGLLERALEATQDALAVEAMKRDPDRFEVLVAGRSGVGGVYDLWRRARAALRGEAFNPAHGGGRT